MIVCVPVHMLEPIARGVQHAIQLPLIKSMFAVDMELACLTIIASATQGILETTVSIQFVTCMHHMIQCRVQEKVLVLLQIVVPAILTDLANFVS
jgi:hypothetical protein